MVSTVVLEDQGYQFEMDFSENAAGNFGNQMHKVLRF